MSSPSNTTSKTWSPRSSGSSRVLDDGVLAVQPYGTFPSRVGTMLIRGRVVRILMDGCSDTPSGSA